MTELAKRWPRGTTFPSLYEAKLNGYGFGPDAIAPTIQPDKAKDTDSQVPLRQVRGNPSLVPTTATPSQKAESHYTNRFGSGRRGIGTGDGRIQTISGLENLT